MMPLFRCHSLFAATYRVAARQSLRFAARYATTILMMPLATLDTLSPL